MGEEQRAGVTTQRRRRHSLAETQKKYSPVDRPLVRRAVVAALASPMFQLERDLRADRWGGGQPRAALASLAQAVTTAGRIERHAPCWRSRRPCPWSRLASCRSTPVRNRPCPAFCLLCTSGCPQLEPASSKWMGDQPTPGAEPAPFRAQINRGAHLFGDGRVLGVLRLLLLLILHRVFSLSNPRLLCHAFRLLQRICWASTTSLIRR